MEKKEYSELTKRLFSGTLQTNILTKISSSVVGVIDLAITGRFLGTTAMAANGYTAAYFFVITLVGRWLVTGCQTQCANELGKGQVKEACNTFSISFLLAAFLSSALAIVGLLFPDQAVYMLSAGTAMGEIRLMTAEYLRGLLPGAPFFALSIVLIQMLQLDGDNKRVRLATIVVALVDIAGDLLNVWVFHGGMYGMGLATSISQAAEFLILLSHFLVSDRTLRFQLSGVSLSDVVPVLKTGWPQALQYTGLILLPIFLNRYASQIGGEAAVAALTVMRNIGRILRIYGESIFASTLMMGKICLSEDNRTALFQVEHIALRRIVTGCGLIALCAIAGAPLIASLYLVERGEVYSLAVKAIRIYTLSLPLQALVSQCGAFLLIFGHVAFSSAVNIASSFLFPLLCCFALGNMAGVSGIWIGFPVASALLYLIILICVQGKRGILQQCRNHLNDPTVRSLEATITCMQEVTEFSEKIQSLCRRNGIDPRRSFHIALCFEELGRNVLQHGFDSSENNHLEVRIILRDDSVSLRMRDDCRLFDFKAQMDEWKMDESTPEKGMGIRIVRGMARNVIYTGTMKTNNLIITI